MYLERIPFAQRYRPFIYAAFRETNMRNVIEIAAFLRQHVSITHSEFTELFTENVAACCRT